MRMRSIAHHAARTCALITLVAASPSTALLGVAGAAVGGVLLTPVAAHAQSSQAAARAAQAVTVRIEGAIQGSGVLMQRDGNRYTVLTAWHVVSAQRPGEELAIYTSDGRSHPLEAGSIRRLGTVDLAVLTFSSNTAYETARIGDRGSVQMGDAIYLSGFPLASTAVPSRLLRFLDGQVIANAQVAIPNGYQLLYSNPTLPGMSGGPVFNSRGEVVGIHGQGETDAQMSEQRGVAVKTGTNQGVPIIYYSESISSSKDTRSTPSASNPLLDPAPIRPPAASLSRRPILAGPQAADQLGQGMQQSIPPVPTKGVVKLGDTLFKIAQRYGMSMQEILRLNPGLDTARLVAGTEIQLVQSQPPTSAKPACLPATSLRCQLEALETEGPFAPPRPASQQEPAPIRPPAALPSRRPIQSSGPNARQLDRYQLLIEAQQEMMRQLMDR